MAFQIKKDFIQKIYSTNIEIHTSFFNIILEYQVVDDEYQKIKSLVEDYELEEFFKTYKELVDNKHLEDIMSP